MLHSHREAVPQFLQRLFRLQLFLRRHRKPPLSLSPPRHILDFFSARQPRANYAELARSIWIVSALVEQPKTYKFGSKRAGVCKEDAMHTTGHRCLHVGFAVIDVNSQGRVNCKSLQEKLENAWIR